MSYEDYTAIPTRRYRDAIRILERTADGSPGDARLLARIVLALLRGGEPVAVHEREHEHTLTHGYGS